MKRKNRSVNIDIDVASHNLSGEGENEFASNPIKNGYSPATVADNVKTLLLEGYPKKQAVAVALNAARKAYFKRYPDGFLPPHLKQPDGTRYRKNPAKKALSSRTSQELKDAMNLYRKFSGHSPELIGKTKKPKIPDVGIVIGELDGVAYETVRDGERQKYFHQFDRKVRPLLISSHDGRCIYILGGEYDFTEDGIVDATDKKFSPRHKRS